MKRTVKHKLLLGLLLFTALFSIVPPRVYAVAGTVFFSPNGGSVVNGTEFTVEVKGDVPKPVTWPFYGGGATIIVSYDKNKLQVVEYNDTNGVFANGSKSWSGTVAGTVKYKSTVSTNAPGVNNQKIISIKFKALTTGSTALSFASGISVNNGPTTGTPSTFTLIAPTCPTGQVGTPPNCTTPAPSPTPKPSSSPSPSSTPKPSTKPSQSPSPVVTTPTEPTPEETPVPTSDSDGGLKIENVKVATTRQTNSVVWTMNKDDALPKVTYGTTKGSLTTEATVEEMSDRTYQVVFQDLKLGTRYYFAIKASTPDQLQAATYSGSLTTRGYPVQLTIKQNGILAPDAKVKINERSFTANKDAIILTELSDGKHEATITPSGSTSVATAQFTVAKKQVPTNGSPELQTFVLDAEVHDSEQQTNDSPVMAIVIGGGVLLAAGAGIIGFLLYKRRNSQQADSSTVDSDLLMASYGPAIENYHAQTPEPNLDARGTTQVAAIGTIPLPEAPLDMQAQPVDQTTTAYQSPPQEYTAPPQAPAPSAPPFDPTTMPLPPAQPPEQTAAIVDPVVAQTNQVAEVPEDVPLPPEQSPALLAVEAIEAPQPVDDVQAANDDTEEAVYHPETGELEILHDHTPATKTPAEAAPPAQPLPTTQQTAPLTGNAS